MKLLTTLAVLCLMSPWQDDAKKVAEEDKKFEGTWQVTELEFNGDKAGDTSEMIFKFNGKKYEQMAGDKVIEAGTQTLNPGKNPKEMDVLVSESEDEKSKGKKQLAIYEIDGDTCTMCFADHGDDKRPTKFSSTEGGGTILVKMKRKKN